MRHSIINFTISTIGVGQPQMALRLARARLDREIAIAQKHAAELAQEPKPELEDPGAAMAWDLRQNPRGSLRQLIDNNDWDALPALAEKSPNSFLDELWAWYLELFETLRHYEGPCEGLLGYALSYDGDYRFEGEHSLGLPEPALLAAVRTAVEGFAAVNPDAFMAWMKQQETVDATPVHRLFAHTLASHPETFAQRALDYLLEDPRRFHLGSIENSNEHDEAPDRGSKPVLVEADIARFEATVAQYAPPPRPGLEDPAARRSLATYCSPCSAGVVTGVASSSNQRGDQAQDCRGVTRFPRRPAGGTIQRRADNRFDHVGGCHQPRL